MNEHIIDAIRRERAFQDLKYGHDRQIDLSTWIMVLESELDEVKHARIKQGREHTLQEILQVVAVGVACLEQHGVVERPGIDVALELGGN